MPRRHLVKKTARFAALLSVSLFLTGLLFISGVIDFLDLKIYDRCMNSRVFGGMYTQNRIIVSIDVNDSSIETLAEQLDTREAFAQAVDILTQSNASVVFDFLFQHSKQDDAFFVGAVEQANDPVIAAIAVDEKIMEGSPQYRSLTEAERQMLGEHLWHIRVLHKGNIPRAGTFLLPFPALGSVAAQIGHINIEPDDDGIYRRIPLFYEWEGGYIPSLSLAAAVLYYGIQAEDIILKAGEYLALPLSEDEVIRLPVDEQGCVLIPYFETWKDSTNRISFHRIVNAAKNPDDFNTVVNTLNNRIALISEISTSQKDFGPTSFERIYPLSGAHIAVLSAILNGLEKRTFIGSTPLFCKILIMLFFLFCAFISNNAQKDRRFHLGYFVTLLSFSGLMFFLWQYAAIAPWYALPVTMLFFLWAGAFLIRLVGHYKEQLLLQNALSRYFPRALTERIMRERKTDLIPAYKELTILFADISSFTRWSSEREPEQVHAFLSDYLESMAGILFAHGGTVDKFMGDGIIAFFGDPLEMPDHCERCLRAAIAMQGKISLLAKKWKPLADIDLKVRIGINTGKVIVGNLGNKTRVEYTVIGAAVNLAQRMESGAPLGGILVTAAVREKVKDTFTFSEKQHITIKGYTDPVEAYILTAVSR
jgi:adenylate cyclase